MCAIATAGIADTPNVVVILIDALRYDHLGCYGYDRPTSPIIDRFADGGVVFETASSPASWTKPTIPSLFTGRFPLEHRVFTGSKERPGDRIVSDVLRDEEHTLAESFRAAGYETAAFVENAQIGSFMGFAQGFDLYAENLGTAADINARVFGWLNARSGERPFFAYVHYLDPHWPYTPPDPYDHAFSASSAAAAELDGANWKQLERRLRELRGHLPEELVEALVARYDGEIRYTDHEIGELFDAFAARGLLDDTIVVITADHGEELGEHGRIGHGSTLYDEVVRVPLMFRGPGLAPARITTQVQLTDVMPTVLDLVGIEVPASVSGRSLRHILNGEPASAEPAFADHRPKGAHGRLLQSVRTDQFKLIRTFAARERDDDAARPEIPIGEWIEIDGGWSADGGFVAFDIERMENEETHVKLSGRVDSAGDGTYTMMGITCRLNDDVRYRIDDDYVSAFELGIGSWVQFKGTWNDDGEFAVRRVKRLPESKHENEIKGPVERVRALGEHRVVMRAGGIDIEIDEETKFKGAWAPSEPTRRPAVDTAVDGLRPRSLIATELYDLRADPAETINLAAREPDVVSVLNALLDQWEAGCEATASSSASIELDDETIERLRSLGYIK